MPARENRLHLLLLPLAAFIAIVPLIVHGCSCGHDFDFHILSWFEAARQFTHGHLDPHWAFTPAYNAGEPRFVFYPPLSWAIGAVLGLIMPWTWTPIVYTWLSLAAAGFALYYCAREFASHNAALLAATFYIVNPYTLFTAYERTAYGELLAAAWIPLLLHAILRERVTIPRIAIPVALLWLADAPAAVMCCYALALLAVVRLILNRIDTKPEASFSREPIPQRKISAHKHDSPLRLAFNIAAGTLLGLGLAAIYIVPAAWERRYIQVRMAVIDGMKIEDNFLFRHTADPDHDRVLLTASIVAIILIVATCVALIAANRSTRPKASGSPPSRSVITPRWPFADNRKPVPINGTIFLLTILTAAIVLLLTPISAPIWNHTPQMRFLQFPWRLLAILAAILAITLAIALSSRKIKAVTATAIILAAALSSASYAVFRQSCDEEDTVQARLALFHSNRGSDPTDEFTPVTADNDALADSNPGWWLADDGSIDAPADSAPGPAPMRLVLDLPAAQTLILNLRDYPAWRITNNGKQVTERDERDDGLIAIPVPAGKSSIAITYAHTLDQTIGDSLTTISLLIFFALLTFHRKRQSNP